MQARPIRSQFYCERLGTKCVVTTTIRNVTDVTCHPFRELVSARIDGELGNNDEVQLDAHLGTCPSCLAFQDDSYALRRALRMQVVAPQQATPDPATFAGSLQSVSALQWALFVVGGTLVLLNAQAVFVSGGTTAAHLSRHDGVFGTALGIGMLAVAAKPHRAIGLVPLTSAIAVLMAIVATADLVSGDANLLAEAIHIVEFAGLICLWVISGGPSRLPKHLATVSHRLPSVLGG